MNVEKANKNSGKGKDSLILTYEVLLFKDCLTLPPLMGVWRNCTKHRGYACLFPVVRTKAKVIRSSKMRAALGFLEARKCYAPRYPGNNSIKQNMEKR